MCNHISASFFCVFTMLKFIILPLSYLFDSKSLQKLTKNPIKSRLLLSFFRKKAVSRF